MKTEKLIIFVVDDSPVALETITRELQKSIHCTVKGFTSAEDCIFNMEDGLPDLILSDYYLDALYERKMNGDQMLARIKVKYPNVPVIMYSSQNNVEVIIRLMKLGATDFITKEKNFIKNISEVTARQVKKIKSENDTAWFTLGTLLTLVAFISSLIAVYTFIPNAIGYFIVGVLTLSCVLAFSAGRTSQPTRERVD